MVNINIIIFLTYLTVSPNKLVNYGIRRLFNMAYGVGAVDGVDGVGCGHNFLPGIAVVVVIILLLIAMGIVF